jgi:hypothetical protein
MAQTQVKVCLHFRVNGFCCTYVCTKQSRLSRERNTLCKSKTYPNSSLGQSERQHAIPKHNPKAVLDESGKHNVITNHNSKAVLVERLRQYLEAKDTPKAVLVKSGKHDVITNHSPKPVSVKSGRQNIRANHNPSDSTGTNCEEDNGQHNRPNRDVIHKRARRLEYKCH